MPVVLDTAGEEGAQAMAVGGTEDVAVLEAPDSGGFLDVPAATGSELIVR
jgi:hypothetical protein